MNTHDLIAALSQEKPKAPLRPPSYYAFYFAGILSAYAVIALLVLGLRPDLALQFSRPFFAIEVLLLTLLSGISTWVAILSMYPDRLQKTNLANLPYSVFVALVLFILFQLALMPHDPEMVIPPPGAHSIECALCIASVSIIPSAFLFSLMKKGATIHPLRSGSFAVLAATGIGCLTLRLAEANDSTLHLAVWHYLPTLLFTLFGASLGKLFLKW